MNWITRNVAIGNYQEAQDVALLRQEGFRAVLGLIPTLQGKTAAEVGVKRLEVVPLEDAPGSDPRLFRRAVDALVSLAEDEGPVFVHCHAGRSRSVVVVAGYLMKAQGLRADEALTLVTAQREAAITPGLERLLYEME